MSRDFFLTDEDFYGFHLLEIYLKKDNGWTPAYREAIRNGFRSLTRHERVVVVDIVCIEVAGASKDLRTEVMDLLKKFINEN